MRVGPSQHQEKVKDWKGGSEGDECEGTLGGGGCEGSLGEGTETESRRNEDRTVTSVLPRESSETLFWSPVTETA